MDESKLNQFRTDEKGCVWRKQKTDLQPQGLRSTVKRGGGHLMYIVFWWWEFGFHRKYNGQNGRNMELRSVSSLNIRNNFRYYPDNPDLNTIENL